MAGTAIHFHDIVEWVPKEDITTWELAKALPAMFAMAHAKPRVADDVRELPATVQRHFKISANPLNM